jgi:hypothetical protein
MYSMTNKQTPTKMTLIKSPRKQAGRIMDSCTANCIEGCMFGAGCEFFSYRSTYRTHQFQFPFVARLHTEHISSSFLLLPVYIRNTSVPVPFCCPSTNRTHQFPQFYCLASQLCKSLRPFKTLGIGTWGLGHVKKLSPCQ